jgi:hypothetical protein
MPGTPMKRQLSLCLAAALLSGCVITSHEQAFYVSPVNGSSSDYQPMPLHSDTAQSAVYARAAYFSGGANDNSTDGFKGANLAVSEARHFSIVECYYGLGLSLGDYHVGQWNTHYRGFGFIGTDILFLRPKHYMQLDSLGGDKFFGSATFNGGINLVAPLAGGEWRFLGVETDIHREFGDYLSFRNKLSDTLADLVVRSPLFATVGITSELIVQTSSGELGFRLAKGWTVGSAYNNLNLYDSMRMRYLKYSYFNGSFHFTYGRYTAYFQVDGATKASSVHIGFVFRLGMPHPAKMPLEIRYMHRKDNDYYEVPRSSATP